MSGPGARLSASAAETNEVNDIGPAYDAVMKPLLSTVLLTVVAVSGCTNAAPDGAAGRASSAPTLTARSAPGNVPAFDLEEATISELQRRMTDCRETARSLVDKYVARIEAIDRNGPALRSVIEINPDA